MLDADLLEKLDAVGRATRGRDDMAARGRGLHSFTIELNVSNSRTRSSIKSSYTVDRRAQVELNWERV